MNIDKHSCSQYRDDYMHVDDAYGPTKDHEYID